MKRKLNKQNNTILLAVSFILIGALLLLGGTGAVKSIINISITLIGVILIVLSIINLSNKVIEYGIFQLVVGIILIVFGWTLAWIAFIILGIVLMLIGIKGFYERGKDNIIGNLIALLLGLLIVLIAFGNKYAWNFLDILLYIAGAFMIVDGVVILLEK